MSPAAPPLILTTTSSFGCGSVAERLARIESSGTARFLHNPHARKLRSEEVRMLFESEGLIGVIAGVEQLGEPAFASARALRALVRCGVGMENVDLAAAERHGVRVSSTPDAPTQGVAELAVTLMLTSLRQVIPQQQALAAGEWKRRLGTQLEGKIVGIVGCGRIGRRTADLLRSFGVTVLGCDPERPLGTSFQMVSLEEIARRADILSLHAAGGSAPLLDRRVLELIRPGTLIVNTARGSLVDEAALLQMLEAGKVRYACDVFGEEPYSGPLCGRPDVVHLPHVGSYTAEGREAMEHEALDRLAELLDLDLGSARPTPRRSRLSELQAVFFDMDGVLIDSVHIKEEGFVAIFPGATEAQRQIIRAHHRAHGGMSRFPKIRHYLRTLFPEEPHDDDAVQKLGDRFGEIVAQLVMRAGEIAGAEQTLKDRPCPLFVVSGTPEGELRRVVSARSWTGHFAGVFGTPRSKSEILNDLLKGYGFDPARCAFVGDAAGDMAAADEAGVPFVGVNVAFVPPASVPTFADLVGFWKQLETTWAR